MQHRGEPAEAIMSGAVSKRHLWGVARRGRLVGTVLGFTLLLATAGLLLGAFNAQLMTFSSWVSVMFLGFAIVGSLIALRRPENPIGWVFVAMGLASALGIFAQQYGYFASITRRGSLPGPEWIDLVGNLAGTAKWLLAFTALMLFPTGRFLSPRWGIAGWALLLEGILSWLLDTIGQPALATAVLPNPLWNAALAAASSPGVRALDALIPVTGLVCLIGVVVRFIRSRSEERLQLKWFAWAAAVLVVGGLPMMFANDDALLLLVGQVASVAGVGALPVAVGIAILRYHLYDIDLIIRRTLVYSLLTALLAAIYFGGVVLLQALLKPLTGAGNDLAVVATTLLIAALFLPLRGRVQGFIDRRFYRRKYDAAQILAAFGEHVRDEVELDRLTGRLVEVVDETMQPAHVSLWLRPPVHEPSYSPQELS